MRSHCIALLIALSISTQTAEGQSASSLQTAAEFIVGNCYRSIDDISRVKSAANLFKWKPLPPDAMNMMKPVDGTDFEGWIATHDGQHFFVGVNRGRFENRPTEICSVVANQPPNELLKIVLAAVKAKQIRRDSDGFQINEMYELQHPTQSKAYLFVVRAVDNQPPINITFMGLR